MQKILSGSLRAVVNDITVHIYEPIHLDDIAERLHYSKEHLCRVFHEETGMTLQDYILRQRISEAKIQLRHTDYSLAEIAENTGFSSQSYFQKVFRKYTGMTPAACRRGYRH